MSISKKLTEDKYSALRETAYQITVESLPVAMKNSDGHVIHPQGTIKFASIDFQAQAKAKEWADIKSRRVDWDWLKVSGSYKRANPKRFEVAIWYNNALLCGLGVGKTTNTAAGVRIDLLEASPKKTPLKGLIFELTLANALNYARSIGAVQLRISHPINEKVRNFYCKPQFKFKYNAKGDFCYRDL